MTYKQFITVNDVRLAYVDFGGKGSSLLALHGHFSCSRTFSDLAEALHQKWHVVALDQRGHGWSDRPEDYSREAYIGDLAAAINDLGLAPAVVLGHSLGGLNAYQLAARHPELVRALIVEDIGADIPKLPYWVEDWPERFRTVKDVLRFLAERGMANDPYFLESLVEYRDGWGFRFKYDHMIRSEHLIEGNWWSDWLASDCPVLLLHGHQSWALKTAHAREMANRRPNTRLVEFPDSGHTIHDDNPTGFCAAVEGFLDSLDQQRSVSE